MIETLKNAFSQPKMRNKILFTLFIVLLYRLGAYIPVPGIPFKELTDMSNDQSGALALMNLFSGGALSNMSLLSVGIMPYITASIIMQLMTVVFPQVKQWQKDGYTGRQKIIKCTRWLTIVFGLINSIGYLIRFKDTIQFSTAVPEPLSDFLVVFTLLIGTAVIMWLGELITQHGVGNGMSVIIFTSTISQIPYAIYQSIIGAANATQGTILAVAVILGVGIIIPAMVFIERAQRKVPVHQSKQAGLARGTISYIPFKINAYGVIAIIFASCLLYFPAQIANMFGIDNEIVVRIVNLVSSGPVSWALYVVLIIFFCFFYASVMFNADDIAENLMKQGSFIPGVRPGTETAEYLHRVSLNTTLPGAIYVAIIAVGSSILFYATGNDLIQAFGGTSILIMISVGLDLLGRIESQSNDYREVPTLSNRKARRRRTQ